MLYSRTCGAAAWAVLSQFSVFRHSSGFSLAIPRHRPWIFYTWSICHCAFMPPISSIHFSAGCRPPSRWQCHAIYLGATIMKWTTEYTYVRTTSMLYVTLSQSPLQYSSGTFTTIHLTPEPSPSRRTCRCPRARCSSSRARARRRSARRRGTFLHPTRAELLIPDLGADVTRRFVKDASGVWVPSGVVAYKAGGGPRHVVVLSTSPLSHAHSDRFKTHAQMIFSILSSSSRTRSLHIGLCGAVSSSSVRHAGMPFVSGQTFGCRSWLKALAEAVQLSR
ncbi:hypothetical protein IEO21_02019 [Rhodonia placenta]|uniref:Uncharacterized protein n=1 Tax=Rhodonia placenta TaxID=104341 RepID=A0A8H7U4Y0_9APHY|nr:hypothetical protein IEO21_02019 [Postia placenta]